MSQKEQIKAYKGPAGGWGALKAVTRSWWGSENAVKNIRTMLKTNQNGGFDCPGCAWVSRQIVVKSISVRMARKR